MYWGGEETLPLIYEGELNSSAPLLQRPSFPTTHVRVTLWCCWWLLTGENGVDKPRDPLCFPSKLVTPLHKQLDLMVVMTQPCGKDPDLMLVIIHKVVDLLPQPR